MYDLGISELFICLRISKLCKCSWVINGGVECLIFGSGGGILLVGDNRLRKGFDEL